MDTHNPSYMHTLLSANITLAISFPELSMKAFTGTGEGHIYDVLPCLSEEIFF